MRRQARTRDSAAVVPAAAATIGSNPVEAADSQAAEDEIRKVVSGYARAFETKDVGLFRTLKPNLSGEEERRLPGAFASVHTQVVRNTIETIAVQGEGATVRVSRHDTLDGSIVSSLPQTFRLAHGRLGWSIDDIGR